MISKEYTSKYMSAEKFRGIYSIKPWWQSKLNGFAHSLIKHRIHPDLITLSGIVCAGLLGVALALTAHWQLLALAVAPLAVGRLAANALDGMVARQSGLARPWGEVFNEGGDRLADIFVFAGLALNNQVNPLLAWSGLILILFSSYIGLAGKAAGGKRQYGGLLAKADRMIYLAIYSLVVIFFGATSWNWLLLVFVPATLITLIQRLRWIYRDLKSSSGE